jgi:hypothetical protein
MSNLKAVTPKSVKLSAAEERKVDLEDFKDLLDLQVIIDQELIDALSPSSNPKVDCIRFNMYKLNKSSFIAAVKKSLSEKGGDMKRSAKNFCMAVKFLTLSRENRSILLRCEEKEENCPPFLSLSTFKNYWGLVKTERFKFDIQFICDLK